MDSKSLEKSKWQSVLDQFSSSKPDVTVTLLVSGADIGAQTEAENVRFVGISYDPNDDDVSIEVEGLDHRITNPAHIEIAYEDEDLSSIEITSSDDYHHIVSFMPAVPFPALSAL